MIDEPAFAAGARRFEGGPATNVQNGPPQGSGRAALARSSISFSWRRKNTKPATANPTASISNNRLIGPATSLIFSPNR
jgi:hypothetical protein